MSFVHQLASAQRSKNSWVCVGLDPVMERLPGAVKDTANPLLAFAQAIAEATADVASAYKPNLAFYEALGVEGIDALKRTIEYIPDDIPVIGDAKRGDVGNTAHFYARALFEVFGFDAATVNPYLGYDSVEPFLSYTEKGVFILCKTSNTGAADFQSLPSKGNVPLFELVAERARDWNRYGNVGLVVGATYPEELMRALRA